MLGKILSKNEWLKLKLNLFKIINYLILLIVLLNETFYIYIRKIYLKRCKTKRVLYWVDAQTLYVHF